MVTYNQKTSILVPISMIMDACSIKTIIGEGNQMINRHHNLILPFRLGKCSFLFKKLPDLYCKTSFIITIIIIIIRDHGMVPWRLPINHLSKKIQKSKVMNLALPGLCEPYQLLKILHIHWPVRKASVFDPKNIMSHRWS